MRNGVDILEQSTRKQEAPVDLWLIRNDGTAKLSNDNTPELLNEELTNSS